MPLTEDKVIELCEGFMNPSMRGYATHELASYGQEAVPYLIKILSGCIRNPWGHPYRNIGAIDCTLVTCKLLRSIPDELLELVKIEADRGHPYAIEAVAKHIRN